MIIDKMFNNYYRVLSYAYDKRVVVDNQNLIPYTQSEISEAIGINKVSINKLFREYMEDDMILKVNNKYYLTERAVGIIRKIKSIRE